LVAPELGERAGPSGLNAFRRAGTGLRDRAVDDVDVVAALGEDDLEVRAATT
jgi:hypothetical protein